MTRPRVVHLVEACAAGVGRHVIDLVRGLAEGGVYDLTLAYSPIRIDSRFRSGLEDLGTRGVAQCEIPMQRQVAPIADLRAIRAFTRLLRQGGLPDIVHTHSGKAGVVGRVVARALGIRSVHTPNGLAWLAGRSRLSRGVYRGAERLLGLWTDILIATSQEESEVAVSSRTIPRGRCMVVPNGIPDLAVTPVSPQEEFGIAPGAMVVGAVGRLDHQKDPGLFLDVATAFCRREPRQVEFVWVGEGPLRKDMMAEASRRGLEHRVRFAGHRANVERLYGCFDVFLMTSRYEGMPYVLIEAMRAARPILAAAVEGMASALGSAGVIMANRDPSDWARELAAILSDTGRRATLSSGSRTRYETALTFDQMLAGTSGAYQRVLQK